MAVPSIISYQLTDETGVVATSPLFINTPSTITIANLQTFADAYTPLLDGITDAQITGIEVRIPLTITGAKSAPVGLADVERTGLFNFEQAGSNYKFGVDVPGIATDVIDSSGRIDLTISNVTNWIAFLLIATAGIRPESKFGNFLLGLVDALRTFRKHRKQLERRTIEK